MLCFRHEPHEHDGGNNESRTQNCGDHPVDDDILVSRVVDSDDFKDPLNSKDNHEGKQELLVLCSHGSTTDTDGQEDEDQVKHEEVLGAFIELSHVGLVEFACIHLCLKIFLESSSRVGSPSDLTHEDQDKIRKDKVLETLVGG